MFSKKEDFTNTIQYKIGIRFDDLHENSYNTVDELAQLFINKDKSAKWKSLNFLNLYYQAKHFIEDKTNKTINTNTNLNDVLDRTTKQQFIDFLIENNIKPIEFFRPNGINNILAWFPVFGILGPMLISTYLVTKLDMSGWWYLSGLVGIGIWLFLIVSTRGTRKKFNPNSLLDYIKSTYVIRYKTLSQVDLNKDLVRQFIKDELKTIYKIDFSDNQKIPLN
jgi:hypothetical protein